MAPYSDLIPPLDIFDIDVESACLTVHGLVARVNRRSVSLGARVRAGPSRNVRPTRQYGRRNGEG